VSEFWASIISRLGASADAPSDSARGIMTGNPLGLLPKESRAKLERLQDERSAARVILRDRSDAFREAQEAHGRAQSEARRALENLSAPPRGVNLDELRTKIEAEGNRHQDALGKAAERHRAAEEAVRAFDYLSDVETWLDRYAALGGKLEHQPLPKPGIGVDAARSKLKEVAAAWEQAEQAPSPKADFLERALAEVDALAEHGKIQLDLRNRGPNPVALREKLSVALDTITLPAERHTTFINGKVQTVDVPRCEHHALSGDAAPTLVWLFRDQIAAKLTAEIEAASDAGALSHADREGRFRKLAEQRLSLEFQEEAAIVHAAQNGQSIPRRRNADARAILQVKEI
jgi:hypothetical protein